MVKSETATGKVPLYFMYLDGDFNKSSGDEAYAKAFCRIWRREGKDAYYEVEYVDPCIRCGQAAPFTVDWLFPSKRVDSRPICSAMCGVKVIA